MKKYATVDEFMQGINEKQKEQVELLRSIISTVRPELTEHIKWNSPSYILNGEDRITFSVRPNLPVAIVLHMGATKPEDKSGVPIMNDPSGLIEWKSDTRGVVSFADLDDIKSKTAEFNTTIDQWLKING